MKYQKKILVMDWLDDYAGSEQIAKYLHQVYNFDKVYTLVNVMATEHLKRIFNTTEIEIKTSPLQVFKKKFRYALPLFPIALKKLRVEEENALIISVTHSVVKGIDFPQSSSHISFLVARNLKYVWEEKQLYFKGFRRLFTFIIPSLRTFDINKSTKPTKIVTVSDFVTKWATEKYKREITTLHPPVDLDAFEFLEKKEDFYVSIGRLEPYKRYDILIDAFNKNGRKLIIIGDGSLMAELKNRAKSNIEFKGYLFSEDSKEYLKRAKAFVFCGKEDFGIALLEPQVCGTPVIAFGAGGALETVVEGETGLLFNDQNTDSINAVIEKFEKLEFNPNIIIEHSKTFSVENFKKNFKEQVEKMYLNKTN